MASIVDLSALSTVELQQLTDDIRQHMNKKNCIEELNSFSASSKRAEVREYLMTKYGRNEQKTLLSDDSKSKGSACIKLKCKDCDSFKLHCKMSTSKSKGGWKFVEGESNYNHDVLCIGSYTPKTVGQ